MLGHLVAGDAPDWDDPLRPAEQPELRFTVEDRTSVRAVVALQVKARRVRLGREHPGVAAAGQRALQEGEVVHLLQ